MDIWNSRARDLINKNDIKSIKNEIYNDEEIKKIFNILCIIYQFNNYLENSKEEFIKLNNDFRYWFDYILLNEKFNNLNDINKISKIIIEDYKNK